MQSVIDKDNKQVNVTIRNFDINRDLVPLVNLSNRLIADGEAPTTLEQQREELRAPNQRPETDRWVIEPAGDPAGILLGQAFGYHTVPERYLAWVEVDPEWRRQGLGRQLLTQVVGRAKSLAVEHILIYANENDAASRSFLETNGFWAKSDYWRLTAPAELPSAAPQWPAGYRIRSFAEVQDFAILKQAYTRSYGDLWGHGANSIAARQWPSERMADNWLHDWDPEGEGIFILYAPDGGIVGLCRGVLGEAQGDQLPMGVVDAPGITADYYHLGLQKPLALMVMQWLRRRGQGPLELWSFGDSATTVALYQEVGFTVAEHSIAYHMDID
ncbi:MAG: GNAT family N-acetyltransferase [Caldilineaceae bacterium]|nr:GNAT family N-acetyltransferase [Caldilineaceae bacterium]